MHRWSIGILVACLLCTSYALYEEEAGVFDWYLQNIGKITSLHHNNEKLYVATNKAVVASLDSSGKTTWRQVLNENESIQDFLQCGQVIVATSGNKLRAWREPEGYIYETDFESQILGASCDENVVVVLESSRLTGLNARTGAQIYQNDGLSGVNGVYASRGQVFLFGKSDGSLQILSAPIKTGKASPSSVELPAGSDIQSLVHSEGALYLKSGTTLYTFTLGKSESFAQLELAEPGDALVASGSGVSYVAGRKRIFAGLGSAGALKTAKLPKGVAYASVRDAEGQVHVVGFYSQATSYVLWDGAVERSVNLSYTEHGLPDRVFLDSKRSSLIVVFKSWTVAKIAINGAVQWVREEALSEIVQSEIVELPPDLPVVKSLILETKPKASSSFSVLSTIDNLFADLRALGPSAGRIETPLLTKDKFGLSKMIIALTASGKLYGLSSVGGSLIWSVQLVGDDYNKLIIQRNSTTHMLAQSLVVGTNSILPFNPFNGQLGTAKSYESKILQTVQTPYSLLLVLGSITQPQIIVEGDSEKDLNADDIAFYLADETAVYGYVSQLVQNNLRVQRTWSVTTDKQNKETIAAIASHPRSRAATPAVVLGDRNVLPKYINHNLISIATISENSPRSLRVVLVDVVTGNVIHSVVHNDCSGPVQIVQGEHNVIYTYWNAKTFSHQLSSIDLYERDVDWKSHVFSSRTAAQPNVRHQSWILPTKVNAMTVTVTHRGITSKNLILGTTSGQIVSIDRRLVDARRPAPNSPEAALAVEELLQPYRARLHWPAQSVISYYNTVNRVSQIKTVGTELESTSVVFASGLDAFFTRVSPAEAYDILNQEFNYAALVLTVSLLCIATVVSSQLLSKKELQRAWR